MYSVVSSYTRPGVYCYLQVVTRPQLTPATCSNPVPVVCRIPPPPVLFYNLFASKYTLNIMLKSGLNRAVQSQPFNINECYICRTFKSSLFHYLGYLAWYQTFVRTAESRILCQHSTQHWFYSTIVVNRSLRVWNERTLRPKCHRRPSHSELSRYRQMAEITLGWQLFAATGLSACIGHGIR